METNKEQLLRNPDIQPTNEVIAAALGEATDAYMKFVKNLDSYDIQLEWRYYNDGKVWLAKGLYKWTGVRGGQKEITVFWLSIWNGFFKVTLYIPEKARADVLHLPLDDKVKQMIADSQKMGKLNVFPLVFEMSSEEMFESMLTIAEFRKNKK